MRTLDEIALEMGTDKSSKGHNYTPYYEMFLSPIRNNPLKLMEIGVWEGASLRMWEEYFPHAGIIGADIDIKTQYDKGRVSTIVLDQSKPEMLSRFAREINFYIDIIIDDGSHNAEDQMISFEKLFPSVLQPGGLYVVEDCLCSYDKDRWGKNASFIEYIHNLTDAVNMNGKISNFHICSNKKAEIQKYNTLNILERSIEWVFVSCGLCVIKKLSE